MTSWDIATPTSLGTGVAKTEINGGQPITKPTQAQTLIEVVPYMASIAAMTAGQTTLTKCIIESYRSKQTRCWITLFNSTNK